MISLLEVVFNNDLSSPNYLENRSVMLQNTSGLSILQSGSKQKGPTGSMIDSVGKQQS